MPFSSWLRNVDCVLLPNKSFDNFARARRNRSWAVFATKLMGVTYFMKVVVVKSPKILRAILRFAFKIKKEDH